MFETVAQIGVCVLNALLELGTELLQLVEIRLGLEMKLPCELHLRSLKEALPVGVFILFLVAVLASILYGLASRLDAGDWPVNKNQPATGSALAMDRA